MACEGCNLSSRLLKAHKGERFGWICQKGNTKLGFRKYCKEKVMKRPVTLFTGQWADMPLESLAQKASQWGFDGLELACSGDHFDVRRALTETRYVQSRWDILNKYSLKCFAISNHLVGQAVCDRIDARHEGILP